MPYASAVPDLERNRDDDSFIDDGPHQTFELFLELLEPAATQVQTNLENDE